MIEITCSCGGTFEVLNEQIARRARCPRCGALASDLLAQAEQAGTVEDAGQAESPEPQFHVFCANHPDVHATQNCMNCAKPLCMTCVRERGYYCSDECRDTVSANEPTIDTSTTTLSTDSRRVERVMSMVVAVAKITVLVAVAVGVGYVGYAIYQSKWGPRPQITASMEVLAGPVFRIVVLESGRILVQADDELSLINLPGKEKLWTVDVHALEEPYSLPKHASSASEFSFDPSKFRDRLEVVDIKGDNVVLHSQRQLVTVNAQTGAVKWKFFEPAGSLSHVSVTDAGVFGIVNGNYNPKARPRSLAVCWALDDGTQRWSDTNGLQYATALVTGDNRLLSLIEETPRVNVQAESPAELTASGMDVNAFKGAMYKKIQGAMAKGSMDIDSATDEDDSQATGPTKNYILQVHAVASGTSQGQSTMALAGSPRFEPLAKLIYVVAGRELLAFSSGVEPSWRTTLPASPQLLAEGGDVVAVATKDHIFALDAASGKQRWSRDGVNAQRLFVGPDGSVYAMLSFSRNEFEVSEAKNFRIEDISIGGTTDRRAPVAVLVRLDPKTGKTIWGVRNIGQELIFGRDVIYVIDTTVELRLLSDTGLNVGYHSIHCLSPKHGKELWTYIKTGDLHEHTMKDGKAFLVTTEGTPLGTRDRPSYNYKLCLVERK